MANKISKNFNIYLVKVTFWCGNGRAVLENQDQSSFSKFFTIVNKPINRYNPNEKATNIYN
jgi:hypothetical protein